MYDNFLFWLIALLAVFITGISKSGFAGGVGVITVPLLALVISPVKAVAIMLPLLLFMDMLSLRAWWGKQVFKHLKLLFPGALLGIALGYLLFDFLDDELLKLILGITSVTFAAWGLLNGLKYLGGSSNTAGYFAGAVSGFTSFLAHAGGPPLNFYLIPLRLPRAQFLGTAVVFLASINVMKLFPYLLLGQINTSNLLIGLLLAPAAWIGVKVGIIIQEKINDQLFYKIILSLLGIIGIKLIVDGIL